MEKSEPRPRCGKKMKAYNLNRVRGPGSSVCGLPENHLGYQNCISEESLRRTQEQRRIKRSRGA